MTISTKSLFTCLVTASLLGNAVGAAPGEAPKEKGIKITLKPHKDKYFLGESILLDYQISYTGSGELHTNGVTGQGAPDYQVIVTDQAGKEVAKSTRPPMINGQGGYVLRAGDSCKDAIPLDFYRRLEKPGFYRVRVAHHLNLSKPPIPKDDVRWGEAAIEVLMPSPQQAKEIVERMRHLESDIASHSAENCTDFAGLRFPVYLPILEATVKDKQGDKRAILGITHMPTPEATGSLIGLLKDADKELSRRIVAALCDRLPTPTGMQRKERENPIRFDGADVKLVKSAWRDNHSVAMRQLARTLLAGNDPDMLASAAYIVEAIGTREDSADLVAAMSRVIGILDKTKPAPYVGSMPSIRESGFQMIHAIEALTRSGSQPTDDPQTSGEIVHFIVAAKQSKDFRPAGWEKRCIGWVRNESPFVREFVLFNSPRPVPDSMFEAYRAGIRKVIGETREQTVIHPAVQCALELKIPVDEILKLLVERVDAKNRHMYCEIVDCFENLLESGKDDEPYRRCRPTPSKKNMPAIKAAWKKFLQDHQEEIRKGKKFDVNSPEIARLLEPPEAGDDP